MRNVIQIILGFFSAIFIISFAVTIAVNARFVYEADIDGCYLEAASGLTREEILADYDVLIAYNRLGGPDTLELPHSIIDENERTHFEEVRDIFLGIQIIAIVTGIITVFGIILSVKKKFRSYPLWSAIIAIILPAIVGIYAGVDWEGFFIFAHGWLFRNDYWMFCGQAGCIINILPMDYFMHCFMLIVGIVFAGIAAFLLWYFRWRLKEKI